MSTVALANKATLAILFPEFNLLDSPINLENPDIMHIIIFVLAFLNKTCNFAYLITIARGIEHLFLSMNGHMIYYLARLFVHSCDTYAESVVLHNLQKILRMFQDSDNLTYIFCENLNLLYKILMISDEISNQILEKFMVVKFGTERCHQLFTLLIEKVSFEDAYALLVARPNLLSYLLNPSNFQFYRREKGLSIISQLMKDDMIVRIIIDSQFLSSIFPEDLKINSNYEGIIIESIHFFCQKHTQFTVAQLFHLFEAQVFMNFLLNGGSFLLIPLTEDIIFALVNAEMKHFNEAIFTILKWCISRKMKFPTVLSRFMTPLATDPKCQFPLGNRSFHEKIISTLQELS